MFVCRKLSEETGGKYHIPLDISHFRSLLFTFVQPPAHSFQSNQICLMKMGFPSYSEDENSYFSICVW